MLCTEPGYNETEKKGCYLEMSAPANFLAKQDFAVTLHHLGKVELAYRDYVVTYLATFSSPIKTTDQPPTELTTCRAVIPDSIGPCLAGIANKFMVFAGPHGRYVDAIAFYTSGVLRPSEAVVFLHVLLTSDVTTQAEQETVCAQFPPEMRTGPCIKE